MTSDSRSANVAVVGAGIVGLAHALAAARRGDRVVVFERHPRAVGASVRNFGMVWPVGQPPGPLRRRALRSREVWAEVAAAAGIALDPCGSLHLAYREEEWAVIREFVESQPPDDATVAAIDREAAIAKSPAIVPDGLLGALWSSTEAIVDPREAIAKLPDFLHDRYGVAFRFNAAVTAIDLPQIVAGGETWSCDRAFVCSGADFETLYPQLHAASGMVKVKLQMMRTPPQPDGFRLGAALCADLTLTHYAAFERCPSLPALKARIQAETPHFPRWGIHVMASQNAAGEVTIGDSHEYGPVPSPFDRVEVDRYILDRFRRFARLPEPDPAETWSGVYAKLPGGTAFIAHPAPGVAIVNGLGGAGMTLSFGLAEEVLAGSGPTASAIATAAG